jgi:hypothetical protein
MPGKKADQEEPMRTERQAAQNPAAPWVGDQLGIVTWIRSMPFVEMKREAAVILNEVIVLVFYIFGH